MASADISGAEGRRACIVLVAPNISNHMGGEASKALQILLELSARGFDVIQVTHARVRAEVEAMDLPARIVFVEDGPVQAWLYKLRLNWPLMLVGAWLLHRCACVVARQSGATLVHFTSPISPTLPYFRLPGTPVLIGPLNGNILHPPGFSDRETLGKRVGSLLLVPAQKIMGALFHGKREALLMVSGGKRTVEALQLAGCDRANMIATLDSGVDTGLSNRPRLEHFGVNSRFVFAGRLVRYKGCDLAIRALRHAPGATLDVIGDGEERQRLEMLSQAEGVADRVNFLGWIPGGARLFDTFSQYRAFVFPSLAEANGIVIQEAMMLGLPVIALDWGGPAMLLDAQTGILITPHDEDQVVQALGAAMRRLAQDGQEAERLSLNARAQAESQGFAWPRLIAQWLHHYDRALEFHGRPPVFG